MFTPLCETTDKVVYVSFTSLVSLFRLQDAPSSSKQAKTQMIAVLQEQIN